MKSMIPFFTVLLLVGAVASVQAISIYGNRSPDVRAVDPSLQQNAQQDINNRANGGHSSNPNDNKPNRNHYQSGVPATQLNVPIRPNY